MRNKLNKLIQTGREKYLNKVRCMESKGYKIVLYGAGKYGKKLARYIQDNGIAVYSYCVTETCDAIRIIDGIPVKSITELVYEKVLFLVAVKPPTNEAVISTLGDKNIQSYIDVPAFIDQILDFDNVDVPVTLEITPKIGCSVNCRYCPQELLINNYKKKSSVFEMSFEVFQSCIDKLPNNSIIEFTGFVEPFTARDTIQMIQYANKRHFGIRLNTTLVGLTLQSFKQIEDIDFLHTCIHLPDCSGYAHIPMTEEYIELLKYTMKIGKGNHCFWDSASSQDEPSPLVHEFLHPGLKCSWNLFDRAGNLSDGRLASQSMNGVPIYCCRDIDLNHNVLLPNGDVQLCCMDYGLVHTIGNLLKESYEEIANGKLLRAIEKDLLTGGRHVLCYKCTKARQIPMEG